MENIATQIPNTVTYPPDFAKENAPFIPLIEKIAAQLEMKKYANRPAHDPYYENKTHYLYIGGFPVGHVGVVQKRGETLICMITNEEEIGKIKL